MKIINLCKEVRFAKIHAFPFSLRKGTKAEKLKQVKDSIKTDRMNELLKLDNLLEEEFKQKYINTCHKVIIETSKNEYLIGHTSNYLEIKIPYQENLIGMMVDVNITRYENDQLYGEII